MIRVEMSVPSVSARVNAVKEINATLHTFQNVGRCPDTHQVGRLVLRQVRHHLVQNVIHLLVRLADGKSADRIAVQLQLRNPLGMLDADVRINRTLIDSEEQLVPVDCILQ